MIVCHCTGATDREIRARVRSGAKSPVSIVCPSGRADAGAYCGGCRLAIERIVRAETESRRAPLPELAPAL